MYARWQFLQPFTALRIFALLLPIRVVCVLPCRPQQGEGGQIARIRGPQHRLQLECVRRFSVFYVDGAVAPVPVGVGPYETVLLVGTIPLYMGTPDAPAHPGAPDAVHPQAGVDFRFAPARGLRVPGCDEIVERFLRLERLRKEHPFVRRVQGKRSLRFVIGKIVHAAAEQTAVFP